MADPTSAAPVVGIDLGGTNMQIGVVSAANEIIGREGKKTRAEEGQPRVIERLVKGVSSACDEAGVAIEDVAAIGIAAPGAIDMPNGVVLAAPNLNWTNVPLRDILAETLRRPVLLDNDVNGAVWGEFRLGAARTRGDCLGVWVGTGVGGGLILSGQLYHGEFHTAGEIGQTVLFPDGGEGRRTVEDFCSRTGMSRTIAGRLRDHPASMMHQFIDEQRRVPGSKKLARAYRAGDELAVDVVDRAADLLGIAIANWVTVLAIDTVVIGGGVTEALGQPFITRIRQSFERDVFPDRGRDCQLVMTELADDAGLLGAALLARETVVSSFIATDDGGAGQLSG